MAFPGWHVAADVCVKVEGEWLCVQLRPEDHRYKSLAWEMALAAFGVVLGSGAHVRRMRGVNQEFMQARGLASGLPAGAEAAAAPLPEWAGVVDVATRGYEEEHGSDEDTTDEEGDEDEEEEYEEEAEDTESDASSTSGDESGDESDMA